MKKVIALLALFCSQQFAEAQTIRTVGPSNDYPTIKAAFDAINTGQLTGQIILQISNSTTETASAVLNNSGSGSASYTSVLIYPTGSGRTISGNFAEPVIDLNGADNVTIDGRVNQTGTANLTIANSNAAATATIRLINDASDNIIRYNYLRGSSTGSSSAVVLLATGIATGNDNNSIDYNYITNVTNAARPVHGVASFGNASFPNSSVSVSYNNIFDYCPSGFNGYGIRLDAGTTECIVNGNSFYDTNFPSVSTNNTAKYWGIYLNNTSGAFEASYNYIGGNAPSGAGTWTKSNLSANDFTAIEINASNSLTSSIHGNVIRNFNWALSSSRGANWTGILVTSGKVSIGTVAGNTIGDALGSSSITFTGSYNFQELAAIKLGPLAGVIDCQNNLIASITCANTSVGNATSFYGIYSQSSFNTTIAVNTIGSLTQANSIQATSAATGSAQYVQGIYIANTNSTYNLLIDRNTIANLSNATTITTASAQSVVQGINSQYRANTITNNIISNLSIARAGFEGSFAPACAGIVVTASGTGGSYIRRNQISKLSAASSTFRGSIVGIIYRGTNLSDISNNFINSLTAGTSATFASVYGINITEGRANTSNNILSIGGNYNGIVYGLYDNTNGNAHYFNTIHVCGAPTGGTNNSYAFYAFGGSIYDVKNNIFYNSRSNNGATGKNYATGTGAAISSLNYNNYYVSGTGGVLGIFAGNDKATLNDWKAATSQDANSLNIDPSFLGTATGTTPNPDFFINGSTESVKYNINNWQLSGSAISGYAYDYSGILRSLQSMGALEFNLALPVTWLSFRGSYDNGAVRLDWSTANEQNNDRFDVEKSEDARNFRSIGSVPGSRTTSSQSQYSFTDRSPSSGKSYYRIRQVDLDGNSSLSDVISMELKKKIDISISPNPVKNQMQVTIPLSAANSTYMVLVTDIKGTLIMTKAIKPGITIIDVNHWTSGAYAVTVWDQNEKIYSKRIIK